MSNKIFIENTEDLIGLIGGYDTEDYKVIEEGDWVSSGKYEEKECIIQDINTGKYYRIFADRTGSYYSDYYYNYYSEAVEVEQIEKVITCWEVVSNE
jgi:hypothetical protein